MTAATFDPFQYLAAAATGCLEAQRALADSAIRMVLDGGDPDPVTTLSEGLIFARLAAAHGDVSDDERVVGMLTLTAWLCGEGNAAELRGEAMARVAMLADAGDEAAEFQLASDAEQATPEIMALAQLYRGRMLKPAEAEL